jgi:hypothetical protein
MKTIEVVHRGRKTALSIEETLTKVGGHILTDVWLGKENNGHCACHEHIMTVEVPDAVVEHLLPYLRKRHRGAQIYLAT